MSNPIRKTISLAGPGPQFVRDDPADPNWNKKLDQADYRLVLAASSAGQEINRGLIRSSNSFVKMWVSWHGLMQDLGRQPSGWPESFNYMNVHDGPDVASPLSQARIQRLDRMIKAANNDGINVVLTVMQSYPTWASAGGTSPHGLGATQRWPTDCTAQSPWGQFINYLICRYKKDTPPSDPVPINPNGPNESNVYGNPYGAWVVGLEFVNEPNWTHWPQGDEMYCRIQEMFKTAGAHADWHGWYRTGQILLGPGTSDEKWDPDESYDPTRQTDWQRFTDQLAFYLAPWKPQTYLGWSMHNYRDIRDLSGKLFSGYDHRVGKSQAILNSRNWTGLNANTIWLTEGGVNKGDVSGTIAEKGTYQDRRCRINVKRMREWPNVPMWSQHVIFDAPIENNNKLGMRNGTRNTDGTFTGGLTHPLYTSWLNDMPPI